MWKLTIELLVNVVKCKMLSQISLSAIWKKKVICTVHSNKWLENIDSMFTIRI